MLPKSNNNIIVLLLLVGIIFTTFGGIMFALPLWVIDALFAHSDCGDRCVPPMSPEHAVAVRPLAIIIAFMIFGFLPLVIYMLTTFLCKRNKQHEEPTQSDHLNEPW